MTESAKRPTHEPEPDQRDAMQRSDARRPLQAKICGVCRPGDAAAAVEVGADYVGVILAAGFARTRQLDEAAAILAQAGAARRVGVFMNDDAGAIVAAAQRLLLDVVQLHGDEPAESVAAIEAAGAWRVWKTVRPRAADDVARALDRYATVIDGLLLDGWSERGAGGVGARFDWDALARARSCLPAGIDLIAAGGLEPRNVSQLVTTLAPDVVDVSSGVEEAFGRKSTEKMRAFVSAARAAAAVGAP